MTTIVRRVRADEAAVLRAVRLAALADSPDAFSATLAQAAALSPEEWERRAQVGSAGDLLTTFLAVEREPADAAGEHAAADAADGAVVGLVGGFRRDDVVDRVAVELVSMWTAPAARGAGVGLALVDAVVAWATEIGAGEVGLWVVRGNEPARRLYERAGFAAVTPSADEASGDPCADEVRMARSLPRP